MKILKFLGSVGVLAALVAVVLVTRPAGQLAAVGTTQPSAQASVPGVATAPKIPLSPAVSPQPLKSECAAHEFVLDEAYPPTAEREATKASGVVIATVTEVGAAQWNTPDGSQPVDFDQITQPVITLYRVSVDSVLRGESSGELTLWAPGGQIGCHIWRYDDFPANIAVGDRYAIFVGSEAPAIRENGLLGANRMWSVDSDGGVATTADGMLSGATFAQRVGATH